MLIKDLSEGLSWRLKVPMGKADAIVYRVIAKSGKFTDGEENALPVLVNQNACYRNTSAAC